MCHDVTVRTNLTIEEGPAKELKRLAFESGKSVKENLLLSVGTAGNLTSDVHLAALALEHGCAICSVDNDYKRFPGVNHMNRLAVSPAPDR
jgi:predicted nucleic acid-binding protein